ncbi:hypothetical protein [Ammoniphilus sp. CFH 90114]|uniref:hypothetical protein n=1 Tax=Ammoniphilus sp. CFH 90114 TaxID=2493665 RepID=UPI0013E90EE6|nr:hypothetical protein [Ammoniphilus sp. CFH 90114]
MSPIMEPLRGKDPILKSQVYSELTPSQQDLFMFYAYYNHAKHSLAEYYWWTAYYLAQPKIWTEIKLRLRNFGDENIVGLLEETEEVLQKWSHPRSMESFDVSVNDLENDSLLRESLSPLYSHFQKITPFTLNQIGIYIRKHPEEFILVETQQQIKENVTNSDYPSS